jgi:hypothetical protein
MSQQKDDVNNAKDVDSLLEHSCHQILNGIHFNRLKLSSFPTKRDTKRSTMAKEGQQGVKALSGAG